MMKDDEWPNCITFQVNKQQQWSTMQKSTYTMRLDKAGEKTRGDCNA